MDSHFARLDGVSKPWRRTSRFDPVTTRGYHPNAAVLGRLRRREA
jgi:hypothetical protein